MGLNIALSLTENARRTPDKVVAFHPGGELTYSELDVLATQFANGLRAQGIVAGDVVAFQLPNIPQFLVCFFGTLKAGAVCLPINPLLTSPEIQYLLEDAEAKLMVTLPALADSGGKAAQSTSTPLFTIGGTIAGSREFDELLGSGEIDPVVGDVYPSELTDLAVLVYTSGTTGRPKGAMLGHGSLYLAARIAGQTFGVREDDVTLVALPMFHVFGMVSVMLVAVLAGGTVVLVPRFEVEPVMDAIEKHGVSVLPGVPTMLAGMLTDQKERDTSRLRVAVTGGAAMPGAVMKAVEERFATLWVMEGYGLTETAAVGCQNPTRENRKLLSIGTPIWGTEMRVVDSDDVELPRGPDHVGEIVMRGPQLMLGYLNRPEATEEAFRNGWFHTGDLGYRDEDGYFFIVDRIKDMIIRGGYNVYPREIEEVLFAHPAVNEVAVIGKPDERLGEEVVAVVSLHSGQEATAEELTAYCKERLAAYKYPREFRIVDELPKTATGKIVKTSLRD
jgi:long-chain acyl-CoA synthetase